MKTNGMLKSPESLSASIGELEGEIDLHWDRVEGASIELCRNNGSIWMQVDIVAISKHTVENLKSGSAYNFRVAALNGKTRSPWSEKASKRL